MLPKSIPLDQIGNYCLHCFSPDVQRVFKDSLTYYFCSACGQTLERSLVIDDKIKWWVDSHKIYWHESVGVLVLVGGKLLTMLRQIYPFSFTIPAGHLDIGEKPEQAALRELREETGINVSPLEILRDNFNIVGDACRRGSDDHRGHLYRLKLDSRPPIAVSDEAMHVRWMTLMELEQEKNLTFELRYVVDLLGSELFE